MSSRKRITPIWHPTWTEKIEQWTRFKIKENMWRFDVINDFDDVLQEARILFWKLEKIYPIVNEPSHFFTLYKTSLFRSFTDKSRIKKKSIVDENIVAEEAASEFGIESNLQNYGYLSLLLAELPDELKTVLGDLTSGRIRLRVDGSTTSKRHRENLNMRLKRRLPHLTLVDPVGDLKRVLKYN